MIMDKNCQCKYFDLCRELYEITECNLDPDECSHFESFYEGECLADEYDGGYGDVE